MSKVIHLVSHFGCFDDHDCQIACNQAGEDMDGSDRPKEVTCKKCLRVYEARVRQGEEQRRKRLAAQEVAT
ncbi:hypothetical protein V0R52_00975 [Pseudomonas asiatica]|uniref:hypothetical protein n=1 Tax=Pseudomonas asiatica TaxID=2219225 RepID=UPI002E7C1888|nr:hypothetical protein [Pseudomonas asiatica]MEE1914955.1 hypothetical protein [Pseudomonas asiatica]